MVATATPIMTAAAVITVNGQSLSESQARRLAEVVVEQSVHLPDMCTLRLNDVGDDAQPNLAVFFDLVDGTTFPIGATLDVKLSQEGDPETVFQGEITAVELEASEVGMPSLTVRGYARSHRLHRGRQSRSFLKMSDSDIAAKVAREVGLQASTDATDTVHDYLLQYNQTNWEFLKDRAARNGYELLVINRTLHFRKPKNGDDLGPDQTLWDNLINIRVRMSAANQASEVIVRGWDPKTKQPIVGTASSGKVAPKIGERKTGAQMASEFGSAKVYVVNQPVGSQTEANALAGAIYGEMDGAFVEAEGTCVGDPSIKAGATIKMDALGTRLSGEYYLTSVVHTLRSDGDYSTGFVVSGRRANTLHESLQSRPQREGLAGVVVGLVTNVTDEDDLGRIKVKLPWLDGEQEGGWTRIASPMAGKERGLFYLPEVDDEVLVAFEHGDPSRPYVVGFLWNGKDTPPKKNSEAVQHDKVNLRVIKSRTGHTIVLDDTDGAEKITIVDKTGKNQIEIESASNKVTLQAEADVAITAKGNVNVNATGDATVEANNATVTAKQNGTLSATANLTLEGKQGVTIEGAKVSIKANASMDVSAGGTLNLKGTLVNIN